MATRGITKSVRRHAGESDASFLQRAVVFAGARGQFCRIQTDMGPLCQRCAPFGGHEGNYVKLVIGPDCYNCNGQNDDHEPFDKTDEEIAMGKMNAAARRLGW